MFTVESVNILSLEEKRYLIHDFNDNAIDLMNALRSMNASIK